MEGHTGTRAFILLTQGMSALPAAEFAGRRQMRAGKHLRREGREETPLCTPAAGTL